MAIVRQGALTSLTGATSLGSATLSLSGLTLAADDYLVVAFVIGDATDNREMSASGDNSGALIELADLFANDTNDTNLWVGYAKQGATVDTSITISVTSGTNDYVAHILQYRGVDTTTPIDVTTTTATGINGDSANPPSLTPVTAGAEIVVVYAAAQGTLTAWTAPTDVDNFVQTASTDKGRLATADKNWTSGAFDPAALTGGTGNAADSWAAVTLALRPAATGTTYNETLSETATPGDGFSASVIFNATISETATPGETLASIATYNVTLSETVTPGDNYAGGMLISATISETATPGDSYSATAIFNNLLTETATPGDSYGFGGFFKDATPASIALAASAAPGTLTLTPAATPPNVSLS